MSYPRKKTHEERLELAQEILVKLQSKYSKELLAVAIFGSISRGEDRDFSDVDMIAIVQGEKIADDYNAIVNGLKYAIDIFSQDVVLSKITSINIRWPLLVGKFVTALPIYDKGNVFFSFKATFDEVVTRNFDPYVKQLFVEQIYEECNKFINTAYYGTTEQVYYNAYHLFTKMVSFLGLINKTFYTSAISLPVKAMSLPINFSSFQVLGKSITTKTQQEADELRIIVQNMLNEVIDYLKSRNIEFEEQGVFLT